MFALFLFAVFAAAGFAAMAVLADSGLRWWSAFGQLRHRLAGDYLPHSDFGLRPRSAEVACAGFARRCAITPPVVRRAA